MKVQVEKAVEKDLPLFADMEQQPGTLEFIVPYSLEGHLRGFADPHVVYLRISCDREIAGFFILELDSDGCSVEFKRIVVAARGRGIGQAAIARMEHYCRNVLGRERIWLDVFAHNTRGRHIYEKLGYSRFSESVLNGKPLLLYEKRL